MRKKIADVYIDPGDGHEFPQPITWRRPYTRKFVRLYARACRRLGQGARIVWVREKRNG